MSTLHITLLGIGLTAFLTCTGWLINVLFYKPIKSLTQNVTNVVLDFHVAMERIEERHKSQSKIDELLQKENTDKHLELKEEIEKVDTKITKHIENHSKRRAS
ncbi:MAG: hypothetical protein ABFD50_19305 [Smithella sp.]